jgi:hypothetical protein
LVAWCISFLLPACLFLHPFRCAAGDGDELWHCSSFPPSFRPSFPSLPLSPLLLLLHPPVTTRYPQGDSQAHPPAGLSLPPSLPVRSGLDRQMHLPSLRATATTEDGGSDDRARSAGGREGGRKGGKLRVIPIAICHWREGSTQTPSVVDIDEEGPCWGYSGTKAI